MFSINVLHRLLLGQSASALRGQRQRPPLHLGSALRRGWCMLSCLAFLWLMLYTFSESWKLSLSSFRKNLQQASLKDDVATRITSSIGGKQALFVIPTESGTLEWSESQDTLGSLQSLGMHRRFSQRSWMPKSQLELILNMQNLFANFFKKNLKFFI